MKNKKDWDNALTITVRDKGLVDHAGEILLRKTRKTDLAGQLSE